MTILRDPKDPRNVEIFWDEVEDAEGYVLRYGIEKDKLHTAYTLRENKLKGSFLNIDTPYFFTVEAFNQAGFGKASDVKEAK